MKPIKSLALLAAFYLLVSIPAFAIVTANDDSYSRHGTTVSIGSVLANDDDGFGMGGHPSTALGVPGSNSIPGTLTNAGSGNFRFTPTDPTFTGTMTFQYQGCNGFIDCDTATVSITFTNAAPSVSDHDYLIYFATGVFVTPAIGPSLFEGGFDTDDTFPSLPLNMQQLTTPIHVQIQGVSPGIFNAGALDGVSGYESFDWHIADPQSQYSNTATAHLFIYHEPYPGAGMGDFSCPIRRPAGNGPQPQGPSAMKGEPVNVMNGNVYVEQNDYKLAGSPSMKVTRAYNSNDPTVGLFGYGWASDFDSIVTPYGSQMATVRAADGRISIYGDSAGSGTFTRISTGIASQLTESGGNFSMTTRDGRVYAYNGLGRLATITDRNGNVTTLTYSSGKLASIADTYGRTITVTTAGDGKITGLADAFGTIATYTYSSDMLTKVSYPDGSEYNYAYGTYNSMPRITEITDDLGHIVEKHDYYSNGAAETSEKDNGVEKFTFTYGTGTTTVEDALGRESTYYYHNVKDTQVIDKIEGLCACGSSDDVQEWTYDAIGNITKYKDGNGHETTYTYNSAGDLLTRTDAAGTDTYTYNSFGQVLTRTDQMSGVTTLNYDTDGNLLDITDALSNQTEMTYNSHGQIETLEDPLNNTTTFTWTDANLTRVTDSLSNQKDLTYDSRSRLDTITNALSHVTDVDYDLNNRLKKVTFPDSNYVEYNYDTGGRKTSFKNERGKITSYAYDDEDRLTGITDPLSHTKTFGYDDMSNLTSVTDANGNTTTYDYNDFDLVESVAYPVPSPSATPLHVDMTYDDVGNLKTRTDTAGRVTEYDYDSANRLIKVTDPLSGETDITYNARSQMTKVTDALNQEYDFTYDALGRQLTQTRNGTTMTFTYDPNGRRITRTDHNGVETTYTYDDLGRLTNVAYDSGPTNFATYGYDEISRLVSAENQVGTVTLDYDNRNRVTSTTDVFSHVVGYSYDESGNRTALTLDSNPHTSYAYDDAGRLITLTDEEESNDFTFTYDAGNRLIGKGMPNHDDTTYDYDGMDRLKRLKTVHSFSTLFDDQYSYNAASQISQIAGLSQTRNFTYDDLDRLTEVSVSSTPVESYSYDAVGNRTASHLIASHSYDPFNILTNSDSTTYTHDANGSRSTRVDNVSEGDTPTYVTKNYAWDEENRLVMYGIESQMISSPVAYEYDAFGRRVKRSHQLIEKEFIYDGMDVLMDDDSTTQVTYQNGPGIDNKLKSDDGSSHYFLQDHLGSTVGLANSSGSVTDSNTYDSFGNGSNSGFPTRYQFTGREFDSTSELHDYRARAYDAQIGRFISEDPIGFQGGDINLYGYVENNPVNFVDPMGKQSLGHSDLMAEKGAERDRKRKEWQERYNERYNEEQARKKEAGWLPENYQCGPYPGAPDDLLPQYPLGFDFKHGGCFAHDICYGKCQNSQELCDLEFFENLDNQCAKSTYPGLRITCYLVASAYYRGVVIMGKNAYREGQMRSGCPCKADG